MTLKTASHRGEYFPNPGEGTESTGDDVSLASPSDRTERAGAPADNHCWAGRTSRARISLARASRCFNGRDLSRQRGTTRERCTLSSAFYDYRLGTFAVEYPGYGLSSDPTTTEQAVYADANQAILHLQQELGVPREHTVLLGQSLGSAVAAEMAIRGMGSRLILLAPFTSMVEMASNIAPILPTRLLVCDRYDTLSKATRLVLPTLLIHGTADTVVPVEMGRRLAKKLASATVEWVPGANHNDLYDVGGASLIGRIAQFATEKNFDWHARPNHGALNYYGHQPMYPPSKQYIDASTSLAAPKETYPHHRNANPRLSFIQGPARRLHGGS